MNLGWMLAVSGEYVGEKWAEEERRVLFWAGS